MYVEYRTKRDSTTTFSRFQNQNHAIPQPNHAIPQPKPARFHNYILTIPQPKSHDSTTKVPRFHNQTPTIPQPNSHDSTTKPPRFHNQNLTIPQPISQDSTTKLWGFHNQKQPRFLRKTTATYFHYTRFLTSYKAFKNHPPPQNNRSNLSLQQAAPLLWEDYRYLLSLKKILDKLQDILKPPTPAKQ